MVSDAGVFKQAYATEMDLETFATMWDLSAPGGSAEKCFLRLNEEEFHCEERPQPDVLEMMPDFRRLPEDDWPKGAMNGIAFTTLTIDTPVYLKYLMARFLAGKGSVVREYVQRIDQLVEGAFNDAPDAVIVCTGLGARSLGGVEDESVYPIRGQTVLLRAPWVRSGRTMSSCNKTWTYIMLRQSGDVCSFQADLLTLQADDVVQVIVGGSIAPNDWYVKEHDICKETFGAHEKSKVSKTTTRDNPRYPGT
ncbi:hypothetical protein DXG03_009745 [Asterophora parasitica]|uniref:FAD dependent oxidoreductase domain-containing protein n=1 Tax=Asterophora parasitica TaxID=117018 RepID=A0A9P7KDB3_9AGAR|nr:hypothetical protein DXG03_009745 [Asterophora parasitica]